MREFLFKEKRKDNGEVVKLMAELCSYDEAYDIYDAEEIGWCAKCKCDKNCPMYKKLHTARKRGGEK